MTVSEQPLISILIPVYNVEEYLIECLDSIFIQIDENVQVVAVEDVSTDGSKQLLLEYQKIHPQLEVVCLENNGGLSNARNVLLQYAKAKYIWFIDSDDLMYTNVFVRIKQLLNMFKPDVLVGDIEEFRNEDYNKTRIDVGLPCTPEQLHQNNDNLALKLLIKSGRNYVWNKIFKKSIIDKKIEFAAGRNYEDIYFSPKLMMLATNFCYLNKNIIGYRQREDSICRQESLKNYEDRFHAWRSCIDFYKNNSKNTDENIVFDMIYQMMRTYIYSDNQLKKIADTNGKQKILTCLLNYLPITIEQAKLKMLKRGWLWRYAKFNKAMQIKCDEKGDQ